MPVGNGTAVVAVRDLHLPALVVRAGEAARYAAEEILSGRKSIHTRAAYEREVRKFLERCEKRGLELHTIRPMHVTEYMDGLGSVPKRQQHLAALRHFFDLEVTRHVVVLNPTLSVRGESEVVVEGKTPEIPLREATRLLASINTFNVVGLRDRAAIGILAYTAARVGAVAKLTRGNSTHDGAQWCLRFQEKGKQVSAHSSTARP